MQSKRSLPPESIENIENIMTEKRNGLQPIACALLLNPLKLKSPDYFLRIKEHTTLFKIILISWDNLYIYSILEISNYHSFK